MFGWVGRAKGQIWNCVFFYTTLNTFGVVRESKKGIQRAWLGNLGAQNLAIVH